MVAVALAKRKRSDGSTIDSIRIGTRCIVLARSISDIADYTIDQITEKALAVESHDYH
jgi:hypothetical protein